MKIDWKSLVEEAKMRPAFYIAGGIAGVLMAVVIVMNLLLIASNIREPNQMPSVFGVRPAIVLSGSMAPTFRAGDVILLKESKHPEELEVGDVACYLYGGKATTHRVIERFEADGKPRYIMKGDYNNVEDRLAVDPEQIQGVWNGGRIPGLGRLLMFMQSTMGMFLLLICPLAGLLSWDIVKRRREDQVRREEWEAGTGRVYREAGAADEEYPAAAQRERAGGFRRKTARGLQGAERELEQEAKQETEREIERLSERLRKMEAERLAEARRRSGPEREAAERSCVPKDHQAYSRASKYGGRSDGRKYSAAAADDDFAYYAGLEEDLDYYEELEEAAEHYRKMKESLRRYRRMEAVMSRCRKLEEELCRYEKLAERMESYEEVRKRPARQELDNQ